MKSIKKPFKAIILVTIAALFIFLEASGYIFFIINGVPECAEVKNHASSFEIVARNVYDLFLEETEKDSSLEYMYIPTEYMYLPADSSKYMVKDDYDISTAVEFGNTQKERTAIMNIGRIFNRKNRKLSSILVNRAGVFFDSNGGVMVRWFPDTSTHEEFHAKYAENGYYCKRANIYSSHLFMVFRKK